MENATKGLLIAAAVLVTIVIIALGVLLLGNSSDISEDAETVGNSVSLATEEAVIEIQGGVYLSKTQFENLVEKMGHSSQTLPDLYNKNYAKSFLVTGYLFKGKVVSGYKWFNEKGEEVNVKTGEELLKKWIPEQLKNGHIKALKNPGNIKRIGQEYKNYKNSRPEFNGKSTASFMLCNCFDENDKFVQNNDSATVTRVIYILAIFDKEG